MICHGVFKICKFIMYLFSKITLEGLNRTWIIIRNDLSFLTVQRLCKNSYFWLVKNHSCPSSQNCAKTLPQQVQIVDKSLLFGELAITVDPVDGTLPPSCMLAMRGSNAGIPVVGWLRGFHVEFKVKVSMQWFLMLSVSLHIFGFCTKN